MTRRTLRLIALAAAAMLNVNASADIVIHHAGGGNHIPRSYCPALDGMNRIKPRLVKRLAPPTAATDVRDELAQGDTDFSGWTFRTGAALNGTLTVDTYKSRFVGTHISGGEIELRYERAATDPQNLRWVQLVITSDPLNGGRSPYIDPYPGDDDTDGDGDPSNDDQLPFYYTQDEIGDHINGDNYDLHFYDFSTREHPPTSFVTWKAKLYLVSWNGQDPGIVTIHDGIQWGWQAGCFHLRGGCDEDAAGDDMEEFLVPLGMSTDTGTSLIDADTIINGQGPGLVEPGAVYFADGTLYWNGHNYLGVGSETIGTEEGCLYIAYDPPTPAVQFDLTAYLKFPDIAQIVYYDEDGNYLDWFSLDLGEEAMPQRIIYEYPYGIGYVAVCGTTYPWSPALDNHLYEGCADCESDGCNGREYLRVKTRYKDCGCLLSAVLKNATVGAVYAFRMPNGECVEAVANSRGIAKVRDCGFTGSGTVSIPSCGISRSFVCP